MSPVVDRSYKSIIFLQQKIKKKKKYYHNFLPDSLVRDGTINSFEVFIQFQIFLIIKKNELGGRGSIKILIVSPNGKQYFINQFQDYLNLIQTFS